MKKTILFALLAVLLLPSIAFLQERIDLTTPVTKPTQTNWKIERVTLYYGGPGTSSINIQLIGTNGETISQVYVDSIGPPLVTTATDLLRLLNTSNNSTTSLQKRILTKLVNDGVISGTVSGSVF